MKDENCKHSLLLFWQHLLLTPQLLENKWIHFSEQFQKRNQKLGVTKLPLQALQAIYKCCYFSSMMSSYIFYIQSISFIIL